jgi:PII-like signaling protein
MIPEHAKLIRIYSNANEKWHGLPLYRTIVEVARRQSLSGASVFPVELGFGTHRRVHDIASDYSSFEIPIVIEIVDAAERAAGLLAEVEAMVSEGLVLVSSARVIHYAHGTESIAAVPSGSTTVASDSARRVADRGGTSEMKIEGDGKRVSVYVGSSDTWRGRNLAIAIVERCRELGMAGATVTRGVMGFGKHSVIHKAHLLGLSDDLPEKIEVIDKSEEIDRLLPVLLEMVGGGLIVVEAVHVIHYRH